MEAAFQGKVTGKFIVCFLFLLGGSAVTGAKLQDCISRAITRHKEVRKLINKVIKSVKLTHKQVDL